MGLWELWELSELSELSELWELWELGSVVGGPQEALAAVAS